MKKEDKAVRKWLYGDFGLDDVMVPEVGTPYWYIRGNMVSHENIVCETRWNGWMSDALRMSRGNFYLDRSEAEEAATEMNIMLKALKRELGLVEEKHERVVSQKGSRIRDPKENSKVYEKKKRGGRRNV